MAAETNLHKLIRTMTPRLNPDEYVFCSMNQFSQCFMDEAIGLFREEEGWSLIMKRENAESLGIPYDSAWAWITLTVHSSLEAVGLTAAFAQALAQNDLSCNVVAACHHDHIFVKAEEALKAMAVLENLANSEKE